MQLFWTNAGRTLTVYKDADDTPIKNESHLMYAIKQKLNADGGDFIKKLMVKDGHMVDSTQYYIRSRKRDRYGENFYGVLDDQYAIRNLAKDYRKNGYVSLQVESL